MNYLLYSIFLLLGFGQIQRLSFFNGTISLSLYEILMFLFILIFFAKKKGVNRNIDVLYKEAVIFLTVLAVSLIWQFWLFTLWDNIIGVSYLLRLLIYFFFALAIFSYTSEKNGYFGVKKSLELLSVVTISFSYGQYFFYPNIRNLFYLGWDPHVSRAVGLFFDSATAGAIFGLLALYQLTVFKKNHLVRNLLLFIALVVLLLLSYSRASYLAFGAGFLYYSKYYLRPLAVLAIFFIFLSAILLLPKSEGQSTNLKRFFSIEARIESINQGLMLWKKNLLLGVGYNRIGAFAEKKEIPNHASASFQSSYVTILATSGIIGLSCLFLLMLALFNNVNHLGKIVISFIAILSLFDNILFQNFVLLTIIFLCSLSLSRK